MEFFAFIGKMALVVGLICAFVFLPLAWALVCLLAVGLLLLLWAFSDFRVF
jgi:hypothetical protein